MTGKTVGGPKILLVDDDKIVIEALTDLFKRILPAVGIVDSATSGVEALELFASNADQYALVLLDMSLEGMQGPEVCRRMRLADCSTPILGMTSFSLNRYRVPLAAAGAQGLVGKGDETQLEQAVSRVLSGCFLPGFETPMAAYAKLKCDTQAESTLTNMQETHHEPVRERISDGWRDSRTARHIHRHRAQAHAEHRQTTELPYATASHHHMVETWERALT